MQHVIILIKIYQNTTKKLVFWHIICYLFNTGGERAYDRDHIQTQRNVQGFKHSFIFTNCHSFYKGKYKGSTLIAMPSCNLATEGTDILRSERISPYLQGSLENFEVFIVSDTVYAFGKVKELE